jgi:hypothetical protein
LFFLFREVPIDILFAIIASKDYYLTNSYY